MSKKIDRYKDLKAKVADCFGNHSHEFEVVVCESGDELTVRVSKMYSYINLTFTVMVKLAEVFGTQDYQVDNWHSNGCETCDYGSKYCHEFTFKKADYANTSTPKAS